MFSSATLIRYKLIENQYVTLKVYDVLGRVVTTLVNEYVNAGEHIATFNASNIASGMYFYELIT